MRSTDRPSNASNAGTPGRQGDSSLQEPGRDNSVQPALDPATLRRLSEEIGQHHFPQLSEQTELVLLEISPHQLHAYWHITPSDLQTLGREATARGGELVLRFYDLNSPPSHQGAFDVAVDRPDGSHYVEVWKDARSYQAELGLLTGDGELIGLVRSNKIELPRAGAATAPGSRVLTLPPLAEALHQGTGQFPEVVARDKGLAVSPQTASLSGLHPPVAEQPNIPTDQGGTPPAGAGQPAARDRVRSARPGGQPWPFTDPRYAGQRPRHPSPLSSHSHHSPLVKHRER